MSMREDNIPVVQELIVIRYNPVIAATRTTTATTRRQAASSELSCDARLRRSLLHLQHRASTIAPSPHKIVKLTLFVVEV